MASPKDFTDHPYSSVLRNSESETIASNIMVILKRTGNNWRVLTEGEYISERQRDGSFSNSELKYFRKVVSYTKNEDTARLFSPTWARVKA